MLLDKLEQESRNARRRQLRFAVALAGVALLVAVFVIGAVSARFDLASLFADPAEAETPAAAAPPASVPEPAPAAAPSSATLPPVTPSPGDDPDAEQARDAFKAALATFGDEVAPRVADPAFAAWSPVHQRDILAARDRAVAAFGEGAYAAALETLVQADAAARHQLAARDAAFDEAMLKARFAYEGDDPDMAGLQIADALRLKPESPDAQALAQRIVRLPELLAATRQAAVARVENDLAAEATHLAAALAIEPARAELADRLATVQAALREQRFAGHIVAGLDAVEARDLAGARRNLAAATAIFAGRDETKLLAGRAAELARALEIERLVAAAAAAERADDWPGAERHYADARKLAPDDAAIGRALAQARAVNALAGALGDYLGAPGRLSSEAVMVRARDLVAQANALADTSPSLAVQAGKLEALVAAYAVKVPVRVVSDGKTTIVVRGVGHVGETTGRTIELRPGRYTFEGTRPGFRSKLVSIDIPPGATDFVLEIVTDERI
jgi:hypothetical protein